MITRPSPQASKPVLPIDASTELGKRSPRSSSNPPTPPVSGIAGVNIQIKFDATHFARSDNAPATLVETVSAMGTAVCRIIVMPHDSEILIVRPSIADGITLKQWLSYISTSTAVRLVPPRTGINPFTKQPTEFKPVAGAAYFDTAAGRCSIAYQSGALQIRGAGEEAMLIIASIASDLGATVNAGGGTTGGA
jgi:hypothetical protein